MAITTIKSSTELNRIGRLAIQSQGLSKANPFGSGLAAVQQTIQHLGYIQLDSISVIQRAHHHVLHTRVPNYKPEMLDKLLHDKKIFEYWSHAAAFLPMENYRYSLPYKHAIKSGQNHWFKNPDKKLMSQLLARIKSDGPLRSRDLESRSSNRAGWWNWKPAKKALEQLYMQGDLMISVRQGFQKTYDLTERVIPSTTNTNRPTTEEFAEHLIEQQLNCHGLVTLKGFTYLRRNSELKKAVKRKIEHRLECEQLIQLKLKDGVTFFLATETLEKKLPKTTNRVSIISPFDNFAIQRERLRSIFDFDYQIECYVPRDKRHYGYFCLPLLFQGKLVGRMDCKAHRKISQLELKSVYIEDSDLDLNIFVTAFRSATLRFAKFQGCQTIMLSNVFPLKLNSIFKKLFD